MTLTSQELLNTQTDAFDVELRFFAAGVEFEELTDLADFTEDAAPAGWTIADDTITPAAPWTEITEQIAADGAFEQDWRGSSVVWSVQLRGWSYDAATLAPGLALCCLRRLTRPGGDESGYDSGWVLWWLGVIDAGDGRDDYRYGAPWSRQVRSVDAALELADSPRLVLGATDIMEGATADGGSLLTPEAEAGNGEFVGTTASVEAANAVDGRLASVWISQYPPTIAGEATAAPRSGNEIAVINEVFFKPYPGWNAASTWWIEIYFHGALDAVKQRLCIVTRNSAGEYAALSFAQLAGDKGGSYNFAATNRLVICADQKVFESLTGGAPCTIVEAKTFGTVEYLTAGSGVTNQVGTAYRLFDLHPTDGFLAIYAETDFTSPPPWGYNDAMYWGSPPLPASITGQMGLNSAWSGGGVAIAGLAAGQSLRRAPDAFDTNQASDWIAEPYPRPGDKWVPNIPQMLRVELPEHETLLDQDAAAGATALLCNTLGWPYAGTGVCEGDDFAYSGRTAAALTGVTGLAYDHVKGAQLWPTASTGEAMTGHKLSQIVIRRLPGTEYIKRGRVYTSPYAGTAVPDLSAPADLTWELDYAQPMATLANGSSEADAISDLTVWLGPPKGDGAWVRSILILIDAMWRGGRGKINEVEAVRDASVIPDTGVELGSSKSAALAEHLVDVYSFLGAAQFTDVSPDNWGVLGPLSLAITPLPQVLDDLAKQTGCVADYARAAALVWRSDPWWPGGRAGVGPLLTLDEDTLRGEVSWRVGRPTVTGVTLTAMSTAGDAYGQITVPPGATGSGVRDLTGYTAPNVATAQALAWNLFFKEQNLDRAAVTIKGIGEWCRPLDRVLLGWNAVNYGQWIVERVAQRWQFGTDGKRWTTDLDLRKYFV